MFLFGNKYVEFSNVPTMMDDVNWHKFFVPTDESKPTVRVSFIDRDENDFLLKSVQNGWSYLGTGDKHYITYTVNNKKLFTLISEQTLSNITVYQYSDNINHTRLGVQFALLLGLTNYCIGVHAVTLIIDTQAVLLVAPSGTGKTTLSQLLCKYCGAAVVNGDFALLSPSTQHGAIFEPTPFCGTSNICHNIRLPISKIVFLEQSSSMKMQPLTAISSLKLLLSNAFLPQWDNKLRQAVESNAIQIVNQVSMCKFAFPPTEEAARYFANFVTL